MPLEEGLCTSRPCLRSFLPSVSSCFYDTRCLADPEKADLNARSWRWQKCYQLAYFQAIACSASARGLSVGL